jgi:hypothetical protein
MSMTKSEMEAGLQRPLVPTGDRARSGIGEKWYVGDRGHAVRVIMLVGAKLQARKAPARG